MTEAKTVQSRFEVQRIAREYHSSKCYEDLVKDLQKAGYRFIGPASEIKSFEDFAEANRFEQCVICGGTLQYVLLLPRSRPRNSNRSLPAGNVDPLNALCQCRKCRVFWRRY